MSDLESIATYLPGRFLVLDGGDGVGKSSQLDLLTEALTIAGLEVCSLRDPGSTTVGDHIREILLHGPEDHIDATCEMLLFMASRAQMLAEKIRPALDAGQVVLCDRFVSSTVAYQGASGVDTQQIIDLWGATGGTWPDLTLVLDLPADAALTRARAETGNGGDRMERRDADYHARVNAGFRELQATYPAPVRVVSAAGDIETVHEGIVSALVEEFGR
jgi:dTMP kinase